jgi:hypothetical protein
VFPAGVSGVSPEPKIIPQDWGIQGVDINLIRAFLNEPFVTNQSQMIKSSRLFKTNQGVIHGFAQ